ncbi:MAG: PfkB family carbohydrate kinase, partial [Actinomycetota bacterium]
MTAVTRVAVVGHVEWVTHALGPLPAEGDIVELADAFDEPAGGGAVTAAQIARLGARSTLYTALGNDEAARRSAQVLTGLGIDVHAATRDTPQRRAISIVTPCGHDRTIIVTDPPDSPRIDDPLPWDDLARHDAVYFT